MTAAAAAAMTTDLPTSAAPCSIVEDDHHDDHDDDASSTKIDQTATPAIKVEPLHNFEPGDHVIRWEMLPIAWPIQIHGIVLNVSDAGIVLVDFGLTNAAAAAASEKPTEGGGGGGVEESVGSSSPTTNANANANSAADTKKPKKLPSIFSSDPKEMEQAIESSFHKLHPKREKQRLNVMVLDDPVEIKKWKKVNYDGGLFGFGGGNGSSDEPTTTDNTGTSNNSKNNRPVRKWWGNMTKKLATKKGGDDEATIIEEGVSSSKSNALPNGNSWWKKIADNVSKETQTEKVNNNNNTEEEQQQTTTADPTEESDAAQEDVAATATPQNESSLSKNPQDAAPSTPATNMNPAMAKLLLESKTKKEPSSPKKRESFVDTLFHNKFYTSKKTKDDDDKDEQQPPQRESFVDSLFNNKHTSKKPNDEQQQLPPKKKKLDLPKADPPKLVLARTRLLLEHGESILPPYHAFHSNSECIAVFCKTGYWTNLQAHVFLHSTAIGNAKTMGAATLGVAASLPFLAPVIAAAGIGMVAAPWWILHSSKQHAEETTLRMTDLFWEQAEPEVFVECIQQWSQLDDYYENKIKTKNERLSSATTTVTDDNDNEDDETHNSSSSEANPFETATTTTTTASITTPTTTTEEAGKQPQAAQAQEEDKAEHQETFVVEPVMEAKANNQALLPPSTENSKEGAAAATIDQVSNGTEDETLLEAKNII
jgi:hypothetical protein